MAYDTGYQSVNVRRAGYSGRGSCLGDDQNQGDANEQEQQCKDELLPNGFGKLRVAQAFKNARHH
jgi:hypothetical protein